MLLSKLFAGGMARPPRRKLGVGEVLFSEGAPADSIFFVEEGCVRLVVYPHDGKQLVLYRAQDKQFFAEDHLTRNTYGYTAIADKPTVLLSIRREVLLQRAMDDQCVLEQLLSTLCERFQKLRENYERLGMPSAKARVLHLLTQLSDETGTIDVSRRLKSLAGDLNLTHEAMYRAVRSLERDGVIARHKGRVALLKQVG